VSLVIGQLQGSGPPLQDRLDQRVGHAGKWQPDSRCVQVTRGNMNFSPNASRTPGTPSMRVPLLLGVGRRELDPETLAPAPLLAGRYRARHKMLGKPAGRVGIVHINPSDDVAHERRMDPDATVHNTREFPREQKIAI
jgi:hypothetical protein